MSTNQSAIDYGNSNSIAEIDIQLEDVRNRVKELKRSLLKEETKLLFFKIAKETAQLKLAKEDNDKMNHGRSDDWDE